jgi:peptidoglycan hydrolase-like protein with peptidoglycan-binding domain
MGRHYVSKIVAYPGSRLRLLPESKTADRINPRMTILHSAVGEDSPYEYFKREGVRVESHAWVSLDGRVETFMGYNVKADANYRANAFAYSIETADNGSPDTFKWTEPQMNTLAIMCAWSCRVNGSNPEAARAWDGTGIGFHTQFGAPGKWTPVAKTCPGHARIKQFPFVVAKAHVLWRQMPYPFRRVLRFPVSGRNLLHGSDVVMVQYIVAAKTDGLYGLRTAALVRSWQRRAGITADGIVGPETVAKFTAVIGRWAE